MTSLMLRRIGLMPVDSMRAHVWSRWLLFGVWLGGVVICGSAAQVLAQNAEAPRFLNERHSYVRGEKAVLRLTVDAAATEVAFDASGSLAQRVKPDAREARYTVDTSLLRADNYEARAQPMHDG